MRGWALCIVVAALAGCADDVSPGTASTPSRFERPPNPGLAPLEYQIIAVTSATVSPQLTSLEVSVPEDVVTVLVNSTLEAGAAYGYHIAMGGCTWDRMQSFVGTGQTIAADCGGLSVGPATMQMFVTAGAMAAKIHVVALVCMPQGSATICPPPAPVLNT